jgi:uncharacterized protein
MTQNTPSPTVANDLAPRFLADRTVGKLARWLRIVGYDTVYLPQLAPDGLIREAKRQGRIILTRNTRLLRHNGKPELVFLRDDRFREQLKQVVNTFPLDLLPGLFSRCIECNRVLEEAAKNEVRERVPEYVWQTQNEFRRCPACHRLYWGATHREHALDELQRLGLLRKE